ncbi:TPA: ATP-binding protein [Burkholderia vietnamiensis]|uniref:ATP-binding protein n=1 Tax=Burkholderia vietnamiensis TaxID=60552 RepID=UPI000A664E28|nr:ATP-binding protein [Burkholderia vietnamiensis]HDR8962472.1 ATP-binding protein [Burkholderia vietnamiensis]
MKPELDSVILHARNAPLEPAKLIPRDNVLETIERAFESTNIVFVEGDPLSGKSELAAQYMRRHERRAVGAFLTASAPIFYSAAFLRLTLTEQIHFLVHDISASTIPDFQVDEAVFNQYILRFQSFGRKSPITFVIDGLSDSEKTDRQLTLEIFNQLPAVQSEFRFLITGSEKLYHELPLAQKNAVKIPRFALSPPETAEYLADLDLPDEDVKALHTYSSGNVGLLHKLRLLVSEGASLDNLLAERKGTLNKIFEYEWAALHLDSSGESVLAFIAFSHTLLTTQTLCELTDQDSNKIERLLMKCRLVERDTTSQTWSIRSEAQKQFVADKLSHLRSKTDEALISRLLTRGNDQEAIIALPAQLVAAGQHTEAVTRLNGSHFSKLLTIEKSLRALKTHAGYGIVSARRNGDLFAEVRFSLIESAINGTTLAASSTYEIEALLALGMEDAAAALALTATTPEERLQQLAAAARCFAKVGKEVPEQVFQTLRALLTELEGELSEPALISIAAELLPVDIDLSLKILESAASSTRKPEQPAANSPMTARESRGTSDQSAGESASKFETAAKLRPVLDAAALIVRTMSAQEVLRRITNLEEGHKLFLLQRWLEAHCHDAEAPEVALVALDIVLRDTSKSPKIKDIREIAVVAPHIKDRESSERVTARLEAQSGELVGHGTTEDAVRLRMSLLRAKERWTPGTIDVDLIDLFAQVHVVSDVGIRTACYAWMLYHLSHLRYKDEVEERTGIIAETTQHLLQAIEVLLSQTADHYIAALDAIRAMCMCDPRRAIDLVERINTEERRNRGHGLVIRCLAVNDTYSENADIIIRSLERITNRSEKERLILFVLHRICTRLTSSPGTTVDPKLLIFWKRMEHPEMRMQAQVMTYKITHLCTFLVPQDSILENAEKSWSEIHESWLKIDLGYWAVSELAAINKTIAFSWLEKVRLEAGASGTSSPTAAAQLFLASSLAGRVFSRLVATLPHEFEPALNRLSALVSTLPGLDDKALIWTQVGVTLWFNGKRDLSQCIAERMIEPLLAENFENNKPLHEEIVFRAAPLLYLLSAAGANARIDRFLNGSDRDSARNAICTTIMRKMLPSDFFQERGRTEHELSYSEAMDILSQIGTMSDDWAIYRNVTRLCNALGSRKNRESIRRNQVADILVDLKNIVERKLPDKNNIKHEGFLIACLAEILRCKISETKQKNNGQWQELLERANAISNGADRVIVVSITASCANGSGPFSDGKWFEAIRRDILAIPSDRDRLERFQWVAEILEPFDRAKCRVLLREAMLASSHLSENNAVDKRQRILDLAHNIDPAFVNEIIDLIDDDPATKFQKSRLKDHSKLLDAKKDAATSVGRLSLEDHSLEELTEIAIRSVASLNAGRQIPQPTRDFMQLVETSKRYPFQLVYPVWLWVVESSIRKATQQSAERTLPALYDCICSAGEVAVALLAGSGGGLRAPLFDQGDIIGPGSREQLFARIKTWVVQQQGDTIHISDPYFGPEDLEVIRAIAEAASDKEIVVITSKEQVNKKSRDLSAEEVFRDAWDDLCDGAPPQTEIVVIGFGTEGKHPIHDRWILSTGGGLRLGTSPNSIGLLRISEISEMDTDQAAEKLRAIEMILDRNTRHWEGHKLHRSRFNL